MPILVMGLIAVGVFLVIGGLLFAAGICERRQAPEAPSKSVSTGKTA